MKRVALCLCLWIICSGLSGCGLLFQTMERPRINIANVTPREIKLFEQVFDLELRIQNLNDSPLPINGLSFELEIDGKPFAAGVSNQNVTVDRLSSAVIHAEAVTTLWGILRQIADIQKTQAPVVTYRMKGTIYSGEPSTKLRFDDSGEFKVRVDSP